MATKRAATSELNSDNWDQEDESEEQGTFKAVGKEELSKRVLKVAKRRLQRKDEQKPLFSGFSGFSKNTTTVPDVKNAFSFLSNANGSNAQNETVPASSDDKTSSDNSKLNDTRIRSEKLSENQYLANIKTLNECLIDWLNACIKKNPSCILTPIFRDYDKHLDSLKPSLEENKESKKNEVVSNFKFNSASESDTTFKSFNSPLNSGTINITHSGVPGSITTTNWLSSNPINKPSIFSNFPPTSVEKPATTVFNFNTSDKGPTSILNSSTNGDKLQASISNSNTGVKVPTMFNFSSKPPVFQGTPGNDSKNTGEQDDESPPVNDFKPVTEDDSVYSQRVKVFFKNDKDYTDRGVGTLYIKETKDSKDKKLYQAVVRADTSLGNILFNIRLSTDIPTKRVGKNNVMIACVPLPDMKTPIPVLLRVKTEEEADELLNEINKYK